jgi:metallophosphoesterase (TIGR03768 family)
MANDDSKKGNEILTGDDLEMVRGNDDLRMVNGLTRRDFVKYSVGTVTCIYLGALNTGCGGSSGTFLVAGYPIDSTVDKTTERMLAFPYTQTYLPPSPDFTLIPPSPNGGPGLGITELRNVSEYDTLGYGAWTFGSPLPIVPRKDIMPGGNAYPTPTKKQQLLNFFAMTDIHITDKEAPNSFITLQKLNPTYSGQNTSIYSPIMPYTTQVLDAAIQTANALHKDKPFDFAISLGDTCNSTSYIELRWYIDVIDGKIINPSSGAHLGAGSVDYQKPFKAAGLDKSIPWYQALGNHDHFMLGSFPIHINPSLGISDSYTSDTIWAVPLELLIPSFATFPVLFNRNNLNPQSVLNKFYAGVINGSTPLGAIIGEGETSTTPPPAKVAADPNRRSLYRTEWIQEYFNTTSGPVGHGFNLVDTNTYGPGFACYSFLPKANVPLKVIVLDDTQREDDGSNDIHGHGFLDATRWAWLQAELAAGQAANQLMIIAAHIPIAVVGIGGETEWWLGDRTATITSGWWNAPITTPQNAVDLATLVTTLQNTPNLLMWIAGHRHLNTVKAFPHPTIPENGFWQVETSSFHDFPQQFRTFEIHLNSDYTISIVTVNVDPAVADGTPAATSRKYAIAAQQIVQNILTVNTQNVDSVTIGPNTFPLPSMDPTRVQDGSTDLTIQYVDLSGAPVPVPYNASYNAELFKQLSPAMISVLQAMFP